VDRVFLKRRGSELRVEVSLHGHLRYQTGKIRPFPMEIEPGDSGRELLKYLNISEQEIVVLTVNGEMSRIDEQLTSGDKVALFPPVSGG